MEEWKIVDGYVNYAISNYGNVYSFSRKVYLAYDENSEGYRRVTLCKDGVVKRHFVHRLVATHFITKEREDQNMVNHKDGNKLNNHVSNLEWCTCSENTVHAFDNNLRTKDPSAPNAKLPVEVVHRVCKLIEDGHSKSAILAMNLHHTLSGSKFHGIKTRTTWSRISSQYRW